MARKVREAIKIETISVTTSGTGAAAKQSTNIINGQILKVVYDKGTVNATTTAVVTNYTALTGTVLETIDSYNVNTASAYRYPYTAVTGASAGDNKWTPPVVNDYLLVTVTGGALSKTFTIYVYYR